MTNFAETMLVAGIAVLAGAFFIYRSVRREGWKRRVLSWVGVVLGGVFIGFGSLLGIAIYQERHTFAGPDEPTAEELAQPAEMFAYRLVADGAEGHTASYQGDVILVNLWATWCVPCLKEMPALEQLQEQYEEAGLTILTLTKEAKVRPYL